MDFDLLAAVNDHSEQLKLQEKSIGMLNTRLETVEAKNDVMILMGEFERDLLVMTLKAEWGEQLTYLKNFESVAVEKIEKAIEEVKREREIEIGILKREVMELNKSRIAEVEESKRVATNKVKELMDKNEEVENEILERAVIELGRENKGLKSRIAEVEESEMELIGKCEGLVKDLAESKLANQISGMANKLEVLQYSEAVYKKFFWSVVILSVFFAASLTLMHHG